MKTIKRSVLTFEQKLDIIQWLKAHPEETKNHYTPQIAKSIKADTGIDCKAHHITSICEAAKIQIKTRPRSNSPDYNINLGTDKFIILAKSIRQIAKELGINLEYIEQINQIIARDPITPGEESSNTENSPSNHS